MKTDISAGKLWGMRRLADAAGRYKMLAVDQRPPIKSLVAERRQVAEAPYEDVCSVKAALAKSLSGSASAVLLDPHFAYPACIADVSPGSGLILTLEDSVFVETPGGRLSSAIEDWSVGKIKRAGGDAVKVLAWYRPDAAAAVCAQQQAFVATIGDACRTHDIPFVFELLVYPLAEDTSQTTDYVEHPEKRPELVIESVHTFADPRFGIDLFKLESPLPAADIPDPKQDDGTVQAHFDALGKAAGRPWVMLSAGAGKTDFQRVLQYAYRAGASGYLAGRAIWWEAFQRFPDLDGMTEMLAQDGVPYMETLNSLTDLRALPWHEHECFEDGPGLANAGIGFRAGYADFEGQYRG